MSKEETISVEERKEIIANSFRAIYAAVDLILTHMTELDRPDRLEYALVMNTSHARIDVNGDETDGRKIGFGEHEQTRGMAESLRDYVVKQTSEMSVNQPDPERMVEILKRMRERLEE